MYQRAIPGQPLRIPANDWNAAMRAAEAYQRSGKSGAGESRGSDRWEFGRINQSVEAGVLSGKTMTVWHGPAWGDDDAATDHVIPVHYATDDMDADTYVIASINNGRWYVQPFACEGEDPE